ncbi:prostaglandin E synthase 2-like [Glandiceps talaboti]
MAAFVRSIRPVVNTRQSVSKHLFSRKTPIDETYLPQRFASGRAGTRTRGPLFKIGFGISVIAGTAVVTFSSLKLYFQGRTQSKLLAASPTEKEAAEKAVYRVEGLGFNDGLKLTIYQYQTCPFCRKVRAYLDFYGLSYNVVEVNPISRKEIKFSSYRKVPIVVANSDQTNEEQQFNDSSVIVSALHSYKHGDNKNLNDIINFFPEMKSKNEKGKTTTEYCNRYEIMLGKPQDGDINKKKEEKKWRRWVDSVFVHYLSPNVYRTPTEALKAFDYISESGKFTTSEKYIAKYMGAAGMYFVSKYLKIKWHLKDDVRESLYDGAEKWMRGVGRDRDFMGGDAPNLADLAMYGVLNAIEGFDAFNDLMKNTNIKPWYYKTKKAVQSHEGGR